MLERIHEAADTTNHPEARKRLFPSLLAGEPETPSDKQAIEDWEEYIQPDLESQFRSAVDTVLADLRAAVPDTDEEDASTVRHIRIPNDHADAWCSALNQARLALHAKHHLPDDDKDGPEEFDNWLPLLQSEIYGVIMEFLIRSVLWDA